MEQIHDAGAIQATDDVRGVAIWQAPSPKPIPVGRRLSLALRLLRIVRFAYPRVVRLVEALEEAREPEPHWYLGTLGTDPDFQGRGIGSALLESTLAECDRDGILAYLESSNETNLPFYSRHGLEVTGEIQMRGGPTVWFMRRAPRHDPGRNDGGWRRRDRAHCSAAGDDR